MLVWAAQSHRTLFKQRTPGGESHRGFLYVYCRSLANSDEQVIVNGLRFPPFLHFCMVNDIFLVDQPNHRR